MNKMSMNKIAHWITGHPLISYFILCFTILWGLLISFGPIYARGVVIVIPILMLALFGPALGGIILSAIIHSEPKRATPGKRLLTFLLTWLVATPVFVFSPELCREGIDLSIRRVVVSAVIALIPAFIVSSAFSKTPGVSSFLRPILKPRGHIAWYITAVLIIPALLILSCIIISWLFNRTKGSILVAGLLHVFSNVSRLYIPETSAFLFIRPVFSVSLIIILYRMWKKPADSDGI